MKLFIEDLPIRNKRILMRVDFNVPLDNECNVVDTTRILAALPSIEYVLEQGGSLVLMSHLGRPQNTYEASLSLAPIAAVLEGLIGQPVKMAPDCVGDSVRALVHQLGAKEVLLLENLRFHRAETHPEEDPDFAKELASFGDLFVNDAFGAAHRKHSSTYTITRYFPESAAAGYLLEKEIHFLGDLLTKPQRPFYALLGGAKISSKIGVIKALLKQVDRLLIGGGMAYTFLKAQGIDVGNSLVENELLSLAKELIEQAGDKLVLPVDALVATECSEDAPAKLIEFHKGGVPKGFESLDIGPETIEMFCQILGNAHTILWNGPVGVYELERFAKGTRILATRIGNLNATSIVGGGDLIAALNQAHVSDQITHISTGGGATLEYLEYGTLPGIEALSEKSSRF